MIGALRIAMDQSTSMQRLEVEDLNSSIPQLGDNCHQTSKLNDFGASSNAAVDQEDARNQALAKRAQAGDFDEELILEQLARNRVFLTSSHPRILRNCETRLSLSWDVAEWALTALPLLHVLEFPRSDSLTLTIRFVESTLTLTKSPSAH
ncbi:hypothetical protein E4U60_007019 [Claviceps pazoutovae]|uniref:Uncharacterized protein n=1 Tax=Claviceps pazoutovae TaxID=1649127 RepID=A0A9P7SE30_9HYPO|nr:hypothetical protein E4U60_007019 [Claviceps pazoutovae]